MKPIVAAIDFSPISAEVLRCAADLARRFEAPLHVVHTVHDLRSYTGFYLTNQPLDSLQSEIEAEARQKIDGLVGKVLGPKAVATVVLTGHPYTALLTYLENVNASFVVVGSHGHLKPEHRLSGSTAERLVHQCPCPVVTVVGAPN